jgi:hypothetical protein
MARKKAKARYKHRRRNPDDGYDSPARQRASRVTEAATDFAYTVGAGFAGYALTRGVARMANTVAGKRYPKLAKHAAALGATLGAAGVYVGSRYWEKVAEYHDAVAVGAGVAVAQTVVQAYLPQWAWVVSDLPTPARLAMTSAPGARALPDAPSVEIDRLLKSGALEEIQVGQVAPDSPGTMGDDELLEFNGMTG